MIITIEHLAFVLTAYLLGSIPSAVWIGKWFYGLDVREHGSGNAGATNVFRVLGKGPGIIVLLMDILKGYLALQLAFLSGDYLPSSQQYVNYKLILGIAALAGHIFPVFAGFRGGKGVAIMLGILIGLNPWAALVCTGVFVVVFVLSGFVSLGSLCAALSYPFVMMLVFGETIPTVNIFAMAVCVLVFVTHQKNIERLLNGTESRLLKSKQK
ncbi:MAG: glycerol-3-phosphate 1-O-acyltransferase PlsY [Bacteroidota bacterium]|jgi:glycerol-3-phosphate acyltransferase PlsY